MVGAKVRKGWPGHPRVERRSAPAGCPACRCRDDASCLLRCQQGPGGFEWISNQPSGPCALSQEEESTFSRGRPGASVQDLIRSPAVSGWWPDAVLHGPRAVHLHPARIPDNSGAAARWIRNGLHFSPLQLLHWRHWCPRQVFPKHSPCVAWKRLAGRGTAKRIG